MFSDELQASIDRIDELYSASLASLCAAERNREAAERSAAAKAARRGFTVIAGGKKD
jgi:hypothetical protein